MKKYTIEQYQKMAEKFNKMSFDEQVDILVKHSDILALGVDYDWKIKILDEEIENQVYEDEINISFDFKLECNVISRDTEHLLNRMGVKLVDL